MKIELHSDDTQTRLVVPGWSLLSFLLSIVTSFLMIGFLNQYSTQGESVGSGAGLLLATCGLYIIGFIVYLFGLCIVAHFSLWKTHPPEE